MSKNPLISVATTCYNQSHFIEDAIKSVVSQAYTNWELVIVNDCSTDKSLKVINKCIEKYKIKDKVIIINNKKNVGCGYSLGKAITSSSGEFIAILDSDDALASEESLGISVKAHLEHPEVALTYSNYWNCRKNLKRKRIHKTKQIDNFLKQGGRVSHLKVIKRKFYDMTEGIDPKLKQTVDKDLVLKIEEVGKLFYIDSELYCYRQHGANLSRSAGNKSKEYRELVKQGRKGIYVKAKKRRKKRASIKAKRENGMKIFIDGSKRAAVNRMFPIWKELGHQIVDHPKSADVQLSVVKIATDKGLPTVLRLDGVYYDEADNYHERNTGISKAHSMADAVVYQSELSKKMCEKYLAKRKTETHSVIHNGIDPAGWGNVREHKGINIVSCAKWRRLKRLPEIIEVFRKFSSKRKKYGKEVPVLHIIGPMKRGASKIKLDNVIYHDKLDSEKIKKIYRTADIYLHLAKKDSCPSTVVEAIAAGIPVVTTNACGGAVEMCKLTKGCVVIDGESESLEPDYIYQDEYNKVTKEVRNAIVKAMIDIVNNKCRVTLPGKLSIKHTARCYLNIMRDVIKGRK